MVKKFIKFRSKNQGEALQKVAQAMLSAFHSEVDVDAQLYQTRRAEISIISGCGLKVADKLMSTIDKVSATHKKIEKQVAQECYNIARSMLMKAAYIKYIIPVVSLYGQNRERLLQCYDKFGWCYSGTEADFMSSMLCVKRRERSTFFVDHGGFFDAIEELREAGEDREKLVGILQQEPKKKSVSGNSFHPAVGWKRKGNRY